ncbi:MAG TPA: addiction module protein [Dongiaceae bacterium]|nr:addiction module protein [Dongiaceae bacterium]
MKSLEDVAADALLLPEDQRFALALRILSSVEPKADAGVEAAWDAEIRERIRRFDSGGTIAVAGHEVFAELDRRLRR